MSSKKDFIKNTLKLSLSIFINKPIGLIRDILKVRYFGIGLLGDAFSIAWRIPNMFRRIFGEGAMTSALVPTLVQVEEKHGRKELNSLTTAIFFIFQFIVLILTLIIFYYSENILRLVAPGALERVALATPMFKILIFFTFFMSASVILGCNLQVIDIFYSGPLSQFFLNIALCLEFLIAIYFKLNYKIVCSMILFNGLIIYLINYYLYKKNNFRFSLPTKNTFKFLKSFFKRVFPAIFSSGISDVNFLIDQAIASYLPTGSQSMLDCISGFIRIPSQSFGSAIATVSAPQFAKIAVRKPERLTFFVLESAKSIFYVSFISSLFFYFFSYKIFYTLFLSDKFSINHVYQAAFLLPLFSPIIFFTTFSKVLLNVFYAKNKVYYATKITLFTSILNTILNLILINFLGLSGIIVSTILAEAVKTYFLINYMKKALNISFYYKRFFQFCKKTILHISFFSLLFYFVVYFLELFFLKKGIHEKMTGTILYWFWIVPLFLIFSFFLFKSRKKFGINLYYLK